MTNKEASNQINDIKTELAAHWLKKDIEALDMALSALSEELSEDGTLIVHIKDGSKVKRVLVMGDNIFGGLYYPDSAENKGDLISRTEVINAIDEREDVNGNVNAEDIRTDICLIPSKSDKGERIAYGRGFNRKYKCDKCGVYVDVKYNFCPNCGNPKVRGDKAE